MTKKHLFLIFTTLLIALIFRLYKFSSPLVDWHSHRQVDTVSVTKNFINHGLNLFLPTYHDLSAHQSGLDNPTGLRLVEFPLYNLISFLIIRLTSLSPELGSRLTSIILSLFSAILVFQITKNLTRQFWPSYFALFFFSFLPFNIFFNRTTLPENTAVFFMLLSLLTISRWWLLSAFFLSLSLLIKPFILILCFPSILFLFKKSLKITFWQFFSFFIVALIPLLLWRHWISHFPQGIPASAWLLNSTTTRIFPEWYRGFHIDFLNQIVIFRPYWWRWLIYERFSLLILGSFGTILAFLGTVFRRHNFNFFVIANFVGIFLYFLLVPGGNIQHDYYQIPIIPFICFSLGAGAYYLINYTYTSKFFATFILLVIICFSFFFSFEKIIPNYRINHPEIIAAGKKVDEITPKNSLIIAPYLGDTAFLFQTNRSGFPIEIYDIDRLKDLYQNQPLYLVSVNFDQYTNRISQTYPTLYQNQQFIILDLNQ